MDEETTGLYNVSRKAATATLRLSAPRSNVVSKRLASLIVNTISSVSLSAVCKIDLIPSRLAEFPESSVKPILNGIIFGSESKTPLLFRSSPGSLLPTWGAREPSPEPPSTDLSSAIWSNWAGVVKTNCNVLWVAE